jgi:thiamine biosynthesis lipoprotein
MQTIRFRAMGSQIQAMLDTSDTSHAAFLAQVPVWFAAWERCLSRFDPASELSALNRRSGQWVRISPVLRSVISHALLSAQQTDGLVTPTLLPALERIGYDRDFAQIDGLPTAVPSAVLPPDDWRAIQWNATRTLIRLPLGMRLDLGGIGKGWAADRTMRRLRRYGATLVDAGGDIALSGPRTDGSPWPIGVGDPSIQGSAAITLMCPGGGVATSGRDYRRWRQGNAERHHILDPHTRLPAQSDLVQVTVLAADLMQAEVAAKVGCILGSGAGRRWLAARPAMQAIMQHCDGRMTWVGQPQATYITDKELGNV